MMNQILKTIGILGFFFIILSFSSIKDYNRESADIEFTGNKVAIEAAENYWFNGQAELSSYELNQARYGEIHKGEATLIFVTEPFSKSKQLKLDNTSEKRDYINVLKLNAVRKFNTGIYPYSTMISTFTDFESLNTMKLTTSVQEWCGHVFMQFNKKNGRINYQGRSYFETEGDEQFELPDILTEDEILNHIRISPSTLPQGIFKILPSTLFLRFNHHQPQVVNVTAKLEKVLDDRFDKNEIQKYTLSYEVPEKREISYYFEATFPYKILGWEDEYKDIAWNSKRKILKTTAVLKKTITLDYWNKNKLKHQKLQLLLE